MFFEFSHKSKRLLKDASLLKGRRVHVLIAGETGTGKELLAKHLHNQEGDPKRPFVAVNCAAIPENLLESELFGHERGAFTGATGRHSGRFEMADGGDIFLDEIGTLKKDLQAKILRAIEEKEFYRVGGNSVVRSDFRVISATNEALEAKVARGDFRTDLYHRLRVMQLTIPPLRERVDDILPLANYFAEKFAPDRKITFSHESARQLMLYHWPGNARELKNVVESVMILTDALIIEPDHFPEWVFNGCFMAIPSDSMDSGMSAEPLKDYIQKAERDYISRILKQCDGDKIRAADFLKIGRTTLYDKIQKMGLAS